MLETLKLEIVTPEGTARVQSVPGPPRGSETVIGWLVNRLASPAIGSYEDLELQNRFVSGTKFQTAKTSSDNT